MSELNREILGAEELALRAQAAAGQLGEPPAGIVGTGDNATGNVTATVRDGRVERITADPYWLQSTEAPALLRGVTEAVNAALADCQAAAEDEARRLNPGMASLQDALAQAQQRLLTAMSDDMDTILARAERRTRE